MSYKIKKELNASTTNFEDISAQYFICPYNASHFVSKRNFEGHIQRCADRCGVSLDELGDLSARVGAQRYHLAEGVSVCGISVEKPCEVRFPSSRRRRTLEHERRETNKRYEERNYYRNETQQRRRNRRANNYDRYREYAYYERREPRQYYDDRYENYSRRRMPRYDYY